MSIKDAIYKKIIFHIINDNSFLYKQAIKEYVSEKYSGQKHEFYYLRL